MTRIRATKPERRIYRYPRTSPLPVVCPLKEEVCFRFECSTPFLSKVMETYLSQEQRISAIYWKRQKLIKSEFARHSNHIEQSTPPWRCLEFHVKKGSTYSLGDMLAEIVVLIPSVHYRRVCHSDVCCVRNWPREENAITRSGYIDTSLVTFARMRNWIPRFL